MEIYKCFALHTHTQGYLFSNRAIIVLSFRTLLKLGVYLRSCQALAGGGGEDGAGVTDRRELLGESDAVSELCRPLA